MKNLSCNIIADLLPMYADGKCSEYTKKCIIHHTDNCKNCRTLLSDMTTDIAGINNTALSDTKNVDSKIKTIFFKKFLIIACAVMMSTCIIFGVISAIFIDTSMFLLFLIFSYNILTMSATMFLSFTSKFKVLFVLIPFFIFHLIFYFCIYDLPLMIFFIPPILGTIAGKIAKR